MSLALEPESAGSEAESLPPSSAPAVDASTSVSTRGAPGPRTSWTPSSLWSTAKSTVARSPARALAFFLIPLAAVPRLWQMVADQGVFWPDEIHQTLEQAHRFAFGYGWLPWEFRDGARSWLFPGFVGLLLKLASFLGLTHSGVGVVMTARTLMLAFALLGVYATMRIGEKIGGVAGAALAGISIALCPPLLVYGTRCMTELASGPLLAVAALLAMDRSTKRAALAGVVASLSIFLRYQNGVFALAFFVLLVAHRWWKCAGVYALAGILVGAAGGILDWITWGKPFHSFALYIRFNLVEGQAARWGVDAFDYYFRTAQSAFGPALILLSIGFLACFARARVLPITCIVNLLVHAWVPHKEFRFLVPMLPLALALAGGGLGWLLGGVARARAASDRTWVPSRFQALRIRSSVVLTSAVVLALVLLFAQKTQTISFADMGQFRGGREDGWSPWNHEAGPNLAYWEAGKHDDLCGITTVGTPLISVGGYSYLHKNVPMLQGLSSWELGAANYIAAPRLTAPPPGYSLVRSFSFRVAAFARSDGKPKTVPDWDYVLFRRDGTCHAPSFWKPVFP